MNNLTLWLKWTFLVCINAVVGLIFAEPDDNWAYNFGIFFGIACFIPIYVLVDNYAITTDNKHLQKSLFIGVIIRAISQCFLVVDLIAGIMAHQILGFGVGVKSPEITVGFFQGFLLTILTGEFYRFWCFC